MCLLGHNAHTFKKAHTRHSSQELDHWRQRWGATAGRRTSPLLALPSSADSRLSDSGSSGSPLPAKSLLLSLLLLLSPLSMPFSGGRETGPSDCCPVFRLACRLAVRSAPGSRPCAAATTVSLRRRQPQFCQQLAHERRFRFSALGPAQRRRKLRLHGVQVARRLSMGLLRSREPLRQRRCLRFHFSQALGLRHGRIARLAVCRREFAAQAFGRALTLLARRSLAAAGSCASVTASRARSNSIENWVRKASSCRGPPPVPPGLPRAGPAWQHAPAAPGIRPSLLLGTDVNMEAMRPAEVPRIEISAPVATFVPYRGLDHAVSMTRPAEGSPVSSQYGAPLQGVACPPSALCEPSCPILTVRKRPLSISATASSTCTVLARIPFSSAVSPFCRFSEP